MKLSRVPFFFFFTIVTCAQLAEATPPPREASLMPKTTEKLRSRVSIVDHLTREAEFALRRSLARSHDSAAATAATASAAAATAAAASAATTGGCTGDPLPRSSTEATVCAVCGFVYRPAAANPRSVQTGLRVEVRRGGKDGPWAAAVVVSVRSTGAVDVAFEDPAAGKGEKNVAREHLRLFKPKRCMCATRRSLGYAVSTVARPAAAVPPPPPPPPRVFSAGADGMVSPLHDDSYGGAGGSAARPDATAMYRGTGTVLAKTWAELEGDDRAARVERTKHAVERERSVEPARGEGSSALGSSTAAKVFAARQNAWEVDRRAKAHAQLVAMEKALTHSNFIAKAAPKTVPTPAPPEPPARAPSVALAYARSSRASLEEYTDARRTAPGGGGDGGGNVDRGGGTCDAGGAGGGGGGSLNATANARTLHAGSSVPPPESSDEPSLRRQQSASRATTTRHAQPAPTASGMEGRSAGQTRSKVERSLMACGFGRAPVQRAVEKLWGRAGLDQSGPFVSTGTAPHDPAGNAKARATAVERLQSQALELLERSRPGPHLVGAVVTVHPEKQKKTERPGDAGELEGQVRSLDIAHRRFVVALEDGSLVTAHFDAVTVVQRAARSAPEAPASARASETGAPRDGAARAESGEASRWDLERLDRFAATVPPARPPNRAGSPSRSKRGAKGDHENGAAAARHPKFSGVYVTAASKGRLKLLAEQEGAKAELEAKAQRRAKKDAKLRGILMAASREAKAIKAELRGAVRAARQRKADPRADANVKRLEAALTAHLNKNVYTRLMRGDAAGGGGGDNDDDLNALLAGAAVGGSGDGEEDEEDDAGKERAAERAAAAAAAVWGRLQAMMSGEGLRVVDVLKLYDRDQSGSLDAAELCQALVKLGLQCSEAAAAVVIKTADPSGDGQLQYRELVAQLQPNVVPRKAREAAAAADCASGGASEDAVDGERSDGGEKSNGDVDYSDDDGALGGEKEEEEEDS